MLSILDSTLEKMVLPLCQELGRPPTEAKAAVRKLLSLSKATQAYTNLMNSVDFPHQTCGA